MAGLLRYFIFFLIGNLSIFPIASNNSISEKDFKWIKLIGEGMFGQVYEVKSKSDNQYYACKVIGIRNPDPYDLDTSLRELDIWKSLDHKNIVKVINTGINKSFQKHPSFKYSIEGPQLSKQNVYYLLFIQLELCSSITLEDWLHQNSNSARSNQLIFDYLSQLIDGVAYMHSLNVMHRDLKPSNIIFSIDHKLLKIGDFGSAKALKNKDVPHSPDIRHMHGTSSYAAPEVLQSKDLYCLKCDVYSLGVIIARILIPSTGRKFFRYDFNILKSDEIVIGNGYISSLISDLVVPMLHDDPSKRLSANEAKSILERISKERNLIMS